MGAHGRSLGLCAPDFFGVCIWLVAGVIALSAAIPCAGQQGENGQLVSILERAIAEEWEIRVTLLNWTTLKGRPTLIMSDSVQIEGGRWFLSARVREVQRRTGQADGVMDGILWGAAGGLLAGVLLGQQLSGLGDGRGDSEILIPVAALAGGLLGAAVDAGLGEEDWIQVWPPE